MKKIFNILLFSLSFNLVEAQSFANYPEKILRLLLDFHQAQQPTQLPAS